MATMTGYVNHYIDARHDTRAVYRESTLIRWDARSCETGRFRRAIVSHNGESGSVGIRCAACGELMHFI